MKDKREKNIFIRCEDGSYLRVKAVTRIYAQEEVISGKGLIYAVAPGPQLPYIVYSYETLHDAEAALSMLIASIEETA